MLQDRNLRPVETEEEFILLMKVDRKNLPTEKLNEKWRILSRFWRRF